MDDQDEWAFLATEMGIWRRQLHQYPEFGFEEKRTSEFVINKLKEFGIEEFEKGIGKTGVVATLRNGLGKKSIAFRADMDALRIEETGKCEYKSKCPGLMHACGHDGHTTMLLGAAKMLASTRDFNGVVRFIFQPAEEWGKGMQAMIDDGLLERFPFSEVYGLHNRPGLPVGRFATRTGAFMGAEDNFEIRLIGKAGHSSQPHAVQDAMIAACSTVINLQTIVSRRIDPSQLSVLSVTELIADGTRNVIPGTARILGDARSFDSSVSELIEKELRCVAEGAALAHGCKVEVEYTRQFVPLINDIEMTKVAVNAAVDVSGSTSFVYSDTPRIGSSEDFARILAHVPGNFMNIGNGDSAPLHNPTYDFNDDALPFGAKYFTELARRRLSLEQ